jgi:hypothetical protein
MFQAILILRKHVYLNLDVIGGNESKARSPADEEPRGRSRVSSEEEGVHQVSRESGGGPREPKQGSHRRTEVTQRTLHWKIICKSSTINLEKIIFASSVF